MTEEVSQLPPAGDKLFNLDPWLQAWVDQLRADPKDKQFFGKPEAEVQMAMVTFRVFGEKLVDTEVSLEQAMHVLMLLWRRGHAQFVKDEHTGGTRLAMPGDPAFKQMSRHERRARRSIDRSAMKAVTNPTRKL